MTQKNYAYTMSELRRYYKDKAKEDKQTANSPLWVIASEETARIINENSREDAIKRLRQLRKRYRNMSMSMTYQSAINQLLDTRTRMRS